MTDRTGDEVLIVGGGIGGLAAALALSQAGVSSRILEQASRFGEIGAGIQLGPNVFAMFDRLGLRSRMAQNAVFVDSLVMMDALSGEQITRVPLDAAFREQFKNPYAVLHRADMHGAILDACRESPRIELQHSSPVTAIEDRRRRVVVANPRASVR